MARILHIVTEVSPAYGGPGTVATQHARGLARRGHDVTLVSTRLDARDVERLFEDGFEHLTFPARLTRLPVKGVTNGPFAARVSVALNQWLQTHAASVEVAHVHFGREMLLMRATRLLQRAGVATILQTHGMVEPSGLVRSLVDALTVRDLLRRAHAVLALQPYEESRLRMVAPAASVAQVPNCIDEDEFVDLPKERYCVEPYVAFVSRLHPRKRVLSFVDMAIDLAARHPDIHFRVIGADDGDLAEATRRVDAADLTSRIHFDGARSRTEAVQAVRDAEVFVLPSANEPFPMAVLEALVMQTPVVVVDSIRIAHLLSDYDAARITDGTVAQLAAAVSDLLVQADQAEAQVQGGLALVSERLSVAEVMSKLELCYGLGKRVESA